MQSPAGPYRLGSRHATAVKSVGDSLAHYLQAVALEPTQKSLGRMAQHCTNIPSKHDHQMAENYARQELRSVSSSQKGEMTG